MNTNFKTFQSFFNKCKKSSLSILCIIKVENGIATISDIETWIQFPVDLPNGYYDLILNEPFLTSELPKPEKDIYPLAPSGQTVNFGTISSKDIVLYSAYVANDELRPVMNSIFINHEFIVSTNAHVLRWKRHELPMSPDYTVLFTPAAALLSKCKETEQQVQISLIADPESGLYKNIEFTFDSCKIIHRMTEGNYPVFQSVIPDFDKQQMNFFSIHSSLVAETLKTAKAFSAKVLQVSDKGFIVENTDNKLFKQFQVPEKAENPKRKPDGIIMPIMLTDRDGNFLFTPENESYLGISPVELAKFTTLFFGKIVLGWYENSRAIGVWLYPETKITKYQKPAPIPIQPESQKVSFSPKSYEPSETDRFQVLNTTNEFVVSDTTTNDVLLTTTDKANAYNVAKLMNLYGLQQKPNPSIPQSFSPLPEREAVEDQPEPVQQQQKQQEQKKPQEQNLQLIKYSDRAVALIGDTKQIKDKLKELWGSYNPNLRINGQTVKGWVFSAKREPQLRQLIAS